MTHGATAFVLLVVGGAVAYWLAPVIVPRRIRMLARRNATVRRGLQTIRGIFSVLGAWTFFRAEPLVPSLFDELRGPGAVGAPSGALDLVGLVLIISGAVAAVALAYRVGYDAGSVLVERGSEEVDLFGFRWSWDPAISDLARGPFCVDRGHTALLVRSSTNAPPGEDDIIGTPDDPLICPVDNRRMNFTLSAATLRDVRRQATDRMRERRI